MNNNDDVLNPFLDPSVIAAQRAEENAESSIRVKENIQTANDQFPSYILPPESTQTEVTWGMGSQQNQTPHNVRRPSQENFDSRTRELLIRESELSRREANLEERERYQNANNDITNKFENNFPPLPSFCCIKPCFYISIKTEIPTEHQRLAKLQLYGVIVYQLLLVLNFITCLMYLGSRLPYQVIHAVIGFFLGLLIFLTSFYFEFWVLYKSLRKNSQFNFILYFVSTAITIVITVVQSIGAKGSGWCGIIVMAGAFDERFGNKHLHKAIGVASAILFCGFACFGILSLYLLIQAYNVYKLGKHTPLANQASTIIAAQTVSNALGS